jgi:hypothetical protein
MIFMRIDMGADPEQNEAEMRSMCSAAEAHVGAGLVRRSFDSRLGPLEAATARSSFSSLFEPNVLEYCCSSRKRHSARASRAFRRSSKHASAQSRARARARRAAPASHRKPLVTCSCHADCAKFRRCCNVATLQCVVWCNGSAACRGTGELMLGGSAYERAHLRATHAHGWGTDGSGCAESPSAGAPAKRGVNRPDRPACQRCPLLPPAPASVCGARRTLRVACSVRVAWRTFTLGGACRIFARCKLPV